MSILNIPNDLLSYIIEKCSVICIKNLSRTCKRIQYLINNDQYIHNNKI